MKAIRRPFIPEHADFNALRRWCARVRARGGCWVFGEGGGVSVAAEIPPPVSLSRPLLRRGDRSAKRGAPLPGWAPLPPSPLPLHSLPARLPSCGVPLLHPPTHPHSLPSTTSTTTIRSPHLIPPTLLSSPFSNPRSASRTCREPRARGLEVWRVGGCEGVKAEATGMGV